MDINMQIFMQNIISFQQSFLLGSLKNLQTFFYYKISISYFLKPLVKLFYKPSPVTNNFCLNIAMGNFKLPATLVLFLAWVSHSTLQNVIPPELEEQIDTFVVQMMEKQHIPGLALSLVRSTGDLHFTKGYGLRDLENNLPADNNTLFAIGSASKSFAGVIIAKKLNELFPALGESVLDVPIRELAPTYDFTLVDRYRSERVTFRDLLAHRVDIMAEMSGMLAQAYDTVDEMFL